MIMKNNFKENFSSFLKKKVSSSSINNLVGINYISLSDFNLNQGKFFYSSNNDKVNSFVGSYSCDYISQASKNIKKNSGRYLQPKLCSNIRMVAEFSNSSVCYSKTYMNQDSILDIRVMADKLDGGLGCHVDLSDCFESVLFFYYKNFSDYECAFDINNLDAYKEIHADSFSSEFIEPSRCGSCLSWNIDNERFLKIEHLQLIFSYMFNYSPCQIEKFFYLSDEVASGYRDELIKILSLDMNSSKEDVLNEAERLGVVCFLKSLFCIH